MFPCVICKFEVELDDVVLTLPRGKYLCLQCYEREMGIPPMPKYLRKAVSQIANAVT